VGQQGPGWLAASQAAVRTLLRRRQPLLLCRQDEAAPAPAPPAAGPAGGQPPSSPAAQAPSSSAAHLPRTEGLAPRHSCSACSTPLLPLPLVPVMRLT
jgi:hypothetical protein